MGPASALIVGCGVQGWQRGWLVWMDAAGGARPGRGAAPTSPVPCGLCRQGGRCSLSHGSTPSLLASHHPAAAMQRASGRLLARPGRLLAVRRGVARQGADADGDAPAAHAPSPFRTVSRGGATTADDDGAAGDRDRASPWSSSSSSPASTAATVAYTGPLAATVTRLKRLSLFSCALTTASAPAIASLEATAGAGGAAQAGVALTIAAFGAATTGLVQWFTGPYVHALAAHAASPGVVHVTTLDFFARRRTAALALADVRPPTSVHPQAGAGVGGAV